MGDTSIDLNIISPLFDRDGAEALFSLPFKLPATATNLQAFGHANRLDNADNTTRYSGALYVDGLPFEPAGVIELDDQAFTSDYIGVVFKNEAPRIFEQLDRLKINDILETIEVPQVTTAHWIFELDPPVAPGNTYSIVINGTNYSYTATTDIEPEVTQSLAIAINADHPGLADAGFYEELRLFSVAVNGVTINGTTNLDLISIITPGLAAQANIQALIEGINLSPDSRVSFPYLYWEKYYKDLVTNYQLRANPWLNGDWISNEPWPEKFRWQMTIIPFVRLPYVLDRIAAAIPDFFTVHSGFFAPGGDGSGLIFFNNRSLDLLYYDQYEIEFKYVNGFKQSINLNQHVPELSGSDLFHRLFDHFALWMRITGTGIEFVKKRDMLAQLPIDWTSMSEPDYTATRRLRRGFTLQYPDLRPEDKNFEPNLPFDGQLEDYVYGEGFEKIPLPFGTCKVNDTVVALPGSGILKTACMNQPGSSDEGALGDNKYSARLLFDRGIQESDMGEQYVMASHDNTDQAGATIAALSLDLNAPDGLYSLHHKGILDISTDGQPVTLAMRLSIADLLEVRKWTNARRTIVLPEGQVTAVIKSIRVKARNNGLGISIVEFVQEK